MFAIYTTKSGAQSVIDKIDADFKNSESWKNSGTTGYGSVIELQNGKFSVEILAGYESYFEKVEQVESVQVKNQSTNI